MNVLRVRGGEQTLLLIVDVGFCRKRRGKVCQDSGICDVVGDRCVMCDLTCRARSVGESNGQRRNRPSSVSDCGSSSDRQSVEFGE